jgi:lysyl-tRNA synthetase, class II
MPKPNPDANVPSTLAEIRATRLEKIAKIKQTGLESFAYRWPVSHHAAQLQADYVASWLSLVCRMKRAPFSFT